MIAPRSSTGQTLERTRAAVLNVLIAVAAGIALSGLILRWRDRQAHWRGSPEIGRGLLGTLLALVVLSSACRRIGASRASLRDPTSRPRRFFRAHLLAAGIGALAIPLGLVYGWLIRPRLDAVSPFWVAALALGFLSWPRAAELDGLDPDATRTDELPT